MQYASTKVEQNGRVLLPVEVRRMLGVGPGDELLIEVLDHGVRLYTASQAVQALQQYVRENTPADKAYSTDDFLAWRREDEQARSSGEGKPVESSKGAPRRRRHG